MPEAKSRNCMFKDAVNSPSCKLKNALFIILTSIFLFANYTVSLSPV